MKKTYPPKVNVFEPEDQEFIRENIKADVAKLLFKFGKDPRKRKLIEQIASRQAVRKKLPDLYQQLEVQLPPKGNLEQSSSQAVAELKATFLPQGKVLLDLTGGFGIDFRHLMAHFEAGDFVEPNTDLIALSQKQLEARWPEKKLAFYPKTAEAFLSEKKAKYDLIYLDPSRRNEQHRPLYAIEEYQPNLLEIIRPLQEMKSPIYAKLSPMIPIEAYLQSLPAVSEVWIISERNECKEVGFFWDVNKDIESPLFRCWDIQKEDLKYFESSQVQSRRPSMGEVSVFLYLPNSSILKAGIQDELAAKFKLQKLDVNSQIFSAEAFVENFPGRVFRVKSIHNPYDGKLKKMPLQVISRNFPDKPEQIQARLKLQLKNAKDFLIATSQNGKGIFIHCEWLVHSMRSNGE